MSHEANKAVVRRYKLDVLNNRNLEALPEVASEDYLDHAAFSGQPPGIAGLRHRLELLLDALDPRWTIEDMVAEDDKVVVRWSHSGVHRGPLLGIPPSGRPFTMRGIDIYRIRDARMVEHWNVVDLLPLLPAAAG